MGIPLRVWITVLALGLTVSPAPGQHLSESTGAREYYSNCAHCHENAELPNAPRTDVLRKMPPERIYDVLTTGTMKTITAAVSDQDKRLIAEWLAGRKMDTGRIGAVESMPNACQSNEPIADLSAPGWNGWGVDLHNTRRQSAREAGLSPGQVSRLELKWAFGFPGATALYSTAVIDGRLYASSNAGYVYSLDAATGCVHWSFRALASVRTGFTIGRIGQPDAEKMAVFFGDIHGTAYAVDANDGELLWKTLTDPHPLSRITGSPVLHDGRLYVPVTSLEESDSAQADYACCTFRGFVTALDATTGRHLWKTYTIAEEPRVVGRNSRGKDMLAPAGAGVWVTPAVDAKRRALYFGTGNAFAGLPKTSDAVMALNMDTGKVLWTMQAHPADVWHGSCLQTVPGRYPPAGPRPVRNDNAPPYPPENCPEQTGPDWDFASSPSLATTADGQDILIAPQKEGLVWALDPDTGAVLWKQDVAREIAGGRGETLFGQAVDYENAYFGLVSGGVVALDLKTGEEVWYKPFEAPEGRENLRGVVAAVTLIPGVVFTGARDGMLRAVSARNGQLLWEFDTKRAFETVNGVEATGGSVASGGITVANGMIFVGSGYPGFQGGDPGNVLLGFAPGVRLDVLVDQQQAAAEGRQQ